MTAIFKLHYNNKQRKQKLQANREYIITSDKAYFEKFIVYSIVLQN